VFVLTDTGETLVFLGQDLARDVGVASRGGSFAVRESASTGRFFGLKRLGEPFLRRPRGRRCRATRYRKLGLGSVRRWHRLQVPSTTCEEMA
jgi:hypothetical protein